MAGRKFYHDELLAHSPQFDWSASRRGPSWRM